MSSDQFSQASQWATQVTRKEKHWCCGTQDCYDSDVVCPGIWDRYKKGHKRERLYHSDCLSEREVDRDPFICDSCIVIQEHAKDPSSVALTSDHDHYDVYAIHKAELRDGVMKYNVTWEPPGEHADTWEPEENIDTGPLLDLFKALRSQGVEQTVTVDPEDYDELGKVFSPILWEPMHRSLSALIEAVWPMIKEENVIKKEYGDQMQWFKLAGLEILATVPFALLKAICGPGIQRQKCYDTDLRKALNELHDLHSRQSPNDEEPKRPGIYLIELVDRFGFSPTIGQMRNVIAMGRKYVDPDNTYQNVVQKVDDAFAGNEWATAPGESSPIPDDDSRRYISTWTNIERHNTLFDALEQRLDSCNGADDEPMPWAMRDVGYTNQMETRFNSHMTHTSSNKLMNLMEALVQVVTSNNDFRVRCQMIFTCWKYEHAPRGEVLFSYLCQSMIETGAGLNGHPPGISVDTANTTPAKYWDKRKKEMAADGGSCYFDNMEKEKETLLAQRKELDDLKAQRVALHQQTLYEQSEWVGQLNTITADWEEAARSTVD